MEKTLNTNTNTKQPKEFEEEIKFNPEFLGLFRDDFLKFDMKEDNNTLYNDISSVVSDVDGDKNKINGINPNNITVLEINTKQNQSIQSNELNQPIIEKNEKDEKEEVVITLDTVDPTGEIKDFSKIKKILKEHNSITTSSTIITHDDMKNIKLDDYEINKLKEIVKYFVNIKK